MQALAFRDVRPVAPSHFLVIPKSRVGLTGLRRATKGHIGLLGHLLFVSSHVASQDPLLKDDGYRVVINDGKNAGKNEASLLWDRLDCLSFALARNRWEATLMASRCLKVKVINRISYNPKSVAKRGVLGLGKWHLQWKIHRG